MQEFTIKICKCKKEFWQSVNSCWLAVGIKGAGFAGEGPIQGRVLEVTVQQWHAVLPGECLALNRVVRGQQELRASRSSCSKWVRSARHAAGLFLKQDTAWITNFFVWLFLSTSWLELVHSWTHVVVLVWINLPVAAQMLAMAPPLGFPFLTAASPSLAGCRD